MRIGLLGIARCSHGRIGLVLRERHWIRYPDGQWGEAFTGVRLPTFWRRWSSRSPAWIVQR